MGLTNSCRNTAQHNTNKHNVSWQIAFLKEKNT